MKAVVVGGGIAGLTAALRLSQAGCQVDLFEASARLGGLICSVEVGGVPMDVGAEAFAVARPAALELIQELGLADAVVSPETQEARILVGGRLIKIPHGVLGIPSDFDSPDVLAAIGAQAAAEAKQRDSQPWNIPQNPTLEELVVGRLGVTVLETLVTPVVSGVHASSPSLLEADVVAPGLADKARELGSLVAAVATIRQAAAKPGAAVATLQGGMTSLIEALLGALQSAGVKIFLNAAVSHISKNTDGYSVATQQGDLIQADAVILAATPKANAAMLAEFPDIATALRGINAVDVTVVALQAESKSLPSAPLGSGVLVAPGNNAVVAKASTHTTAKWKHASERAGAGRHLIRLSYGRDGEAPQASELLTQTAKQDAVRLFGLNESDIRAVVTQEWPQSLIQARVGHKGLLNDLQIALAAQPGLAVVGAGLGGNGITGIIAKTNDEMVRILKTNAR